VAAVERSPRATIRDVAEHARVGIATVSRALNDDPGIATATRARVLAACEELGFRRSSLARGLKLGATDNVGVAIMSRHAPVILNPFYAEVIGGIEEVLEGADKHLLLSSLKRGGDLLALANEGRVDGLLVVGCGIAPEVLERLRRAALPVVLIDHAFEGLPSVVVNHLGAGRQAAEHLLAGGGTRFAFVTENLDNPNFRARLVGFRTALGEAGALLDEGAIAAGGDSWDGGFVAMQRILDRVPTPPDAVFAANDPAAMSAAKAVLERGLRIPEDVSLVGVDDIHLAAHHAPPLSTVRFDKRGLGRSGAGYLLERLAGRDVPDLTVLPTELVVRASSRSGDGAR
jgi:DNA-binding LacI/PurR family transcriptional regulator